MDVKKLTLRTSGTTFALIILFDAALIAFPLLTIPRLGPLDSQSILVVALSCAFYCWLICWLTLYMLENKISLSNTVLSIRTPQIKGFLLLKMDSLNIELKGISAVYIGDLQYLQRKLEGDSANLSQLREFYEKHMSDSLFFTRGEEPQQKPALAVLSGDGKIHFAGAKAYSAKSLKTLTEALKEKGLTATIQKSMLA